MTVDVRYFGAKSSGLCRIQGQPWKEFVFGSSLSTMKRRAIDLVDAAKENLAEDTLRMVERAAAEKKAS